MDDGSIVAFGLILTVAVAAFTLHRHRKHPDVVKFCFTVLVFWALLMIVVCPPLYFKSVGGQCIVRMVLISSCCFALTFVGVSSRRTSLVVPVFSYAVMISLIIYANMLIHGGGYTTISRPFEHTGRYRTSQRFLKVYLGEVAKTDARSYPPGWLSGMPFDKGFSSAYVHHRGIPRPYWHSWLTGLYGADARQFELWYPGGKIKDAIGKIEFRPR
ncbi:MAG: hypothetical protein ACYC7E_03460 [Armatimonadota bacterium]